MNWVDGIDQITAKKFIHNQNELHNVICYPEGCEKLLDNAIVDADQNAPIRTRKTGVWSEEVPKSTRGKNGSNIIEQERFQIQKEDESEEDIPVIPDIEDLLEDPLNLPDVKPMVSVDKLTYKELNNQFVDFQNEKSNFGELRDTDLSFLTIKLYPERDIDDPIEVWTMETLFTDLLRSATS